MSMWKTAAAMVMVGGVLMSPVAESSAAPALQTTNWAGYQVSGAHLTMARATWVVPSVTWPGHNGYSAQWVGLGGGTTAHDSLIQAGTEADVVCTRVRAKRCTATASQYWAWLETYPARRQERINNLPLKAGDTVTSTVSFDAKSQTASFTVCDWSSNKCVSSTRSSSAPGNVAEVILERPASYNLTPAALGDLTPWKVFGADFINGGANVMLNQLPTREIIMPSPRVIPTPLDAQSGAFSVQAQPRK